MDFLRMKLTGQKAMELHLWLLKTFTSKFLS